MVSFKQYRKIIFLVLGLFIIGGYFTILFAEEKAIETYYPQVSRKECLKNFDINNVNFKDPKAIRNMPLLAEYFQCRSAVRDNINECNNLDPWPDRVETCRRYFNKYHGFFGRLLIENKITPQILAANKDRWKGAKREDHDLFAKGWLSDDISVCEKSFFVAFQNRCKSMISGDSKYCEGDTQCRYQAFYVKAIKTRDLKECEKINNSMVRVMCQAYITSDEKVCEKNKGFEEFRDKYCE